MRKPYKIWFDEACKNALEAICKQRGDVPQQKAGEILEQWVIGELNK